MNSDDPRSDDVRVSSAYPLGPTVSPDGTNFSVFSAHATGMQLVFFANAGDAQPSRTLDFNPRKDRTSHYWHLFVPGIEAGQLYGYRAAGPDDPANGHRFDPGKVLLDPYAKAVSLCANYSRAAACRPGDNAAECMKSVVADLSTFDWEGDHPLNLEYRKSVIYEMHLGGFTRDASSGVTPSKRGTYLGLLEKIPYLKELGITAVELLPIFQFDSQDAPSGLTNYWGYSPVSFFAPHLAYSTGTDPLACLDEFRTMVKELHRAGIEVILDVVYNHTAEGGEQGPTLSLRGLENRFYYIQDHQSSAYANYTGAGNTLKANNSVVKRLILDSLKYWVAEMHVDGFRFDLASVFSRDEWGNPMTNPPIVWEIDSQPVLAGTKLIAEAWDSGLYQVGSFGQDKWKEWNGLFRDDVRGFMKGDRDTTSRISKRLLGSPDLYAGSNRPTGQSINFVTCHDGFTLNDLVSYDEKHNQANSELENDGTSANLSWNCGVEGPSEEAVVEQLRLRQIKNFFVMTLLSMGTPMLLMGDEVRRTQQGNNNAYCQDNATSWFDWTLVERNRELLQFVSQLIRFRLEFNSEEEEGAQSLDDFLKQAEVRWHGVALNQPDWGPDSHAIAFTLQDPFGGRVFYVAYNAFWEPLSFQLPLLNEQQGSWWRVLDTSFAAPADTAGQGTMLQNTHSEYLLQARSALLLECRPSQPKSS